MCRLLCLENISMSFGARDLFYIEKLEVFEGDRIGLVGLNGSGKSTLLRLINGEIVPDSGSVKLDCTPAYLSQLSGEGTETVDPKELSLFGVQQLADRKITSGGENTRLRLAGLFSVGNTLLLLDEPTSHLDEQGFEYLDQRLGMIESFIIVSHDRELLDRQCNTIVEIENGEVRTYPGNYSSYCEQKKQAVERAYFEYEQYTDEVKRLSAVYRKKKEQAQKISQKPRGLSSSQAKVRDFTSLRRSPKGKAKSMDQSAENIKKRIEHMEIKEKPRELPQMRPIFSLTDPPRNPVIMEAEHLSFSYPDGKEIFCDTVFRLMRDSRTVLLGENGSGKTTLIRLILEGKLIRIVPKAKIGYLKQDLSDLKPEKTVLENIMETSIQSVSILLPGTVPEDRENNPAEMDEDIRVMKDPRFMEIFRMVDYSICSIEVDTDKPYAKSLLIRKDADGNEIRRELQQDSTGVREFFAWSVQIFRAVYENRVVFADEMDRVLNPILSDRVIALVNGVEHRGQFVFSTHNVLHLNLKTYMKEQIYFVTKSKDSLTSELYSLADFPEVRYETSKVYEFYMKGILGGTAFE